MTKEERIEAIKKIREFEADQRILEEYQADAERYSEYQEEQRLREEEGPSPVEESEHYEEKAREEEMYNLSRSLEEDHREMEVLHDDLEDRAREIEALRYQLSEPEDPIQEAGRRLVNHAEKIGTTARGLVTDLFPYIYAASKRMSTRAISSYLQKNHNVKISPATIARALREPKKHIEVFAETVEPHARNLAEAHGVDILTVLKDKIGFLRIISKGPEVKANNSDEEAAVSLQYEEARGFIAGTWFTIAPELRAMTYKVIEEQLKEEANEQSAE